MSAIQSILLGLGLLIVAFTLRRSAMSRGGRSRNSGAPAGGVTQGDPAGIAAIREMELRLYEYGREIDARLQTRTAVLDRLLMDADREIAQLREALRQSPLVGRSSGNSRPPDVVSFSEPPAKRNREFTPEQHRMLRHLAAAGFSPAEVAHFIGATPADVVGALQVEARPADAA